MGMPIEPARPADPYNCADGFASWEEGMVLQGPREGVPWSGWWLRDFSAVRLQRWFCQLDGRMGSGKEGMVLPAWRQGMPAGDRRLCVDCDFSQELCREVCGGLQCWRLASSSGSVVHLAGPCAPDWSLT